MFLDCRSPERGEDEIFVALCAERHSTQPALDGGTSDSLCWRVRPRNARRDKDCDRPHVNARRYYHRLTENRRPSGGWSFVNPARGFAPNGFQECEPCVYRKLKTAPAVQERN